MADGGHLQKLAMSKLDQLEEDRATPDIFFSDANWHLQNVQRIIEIPAKKELLCGAEAAGLAERCAKLKSQLLQRKALETCAALESVEDVSKVNKSASDAGLVE